MSEIFEVNYNGKMFEFDVYVIEDKKNEEYIFYPSLRTLEAWQYIQKIEYKFIKPSIAHTKIKKVGTEMDYSLVNNTFTLIRLDVENDPSKWLNF
ncbi:MAG: hypothetical protein A2X47_00740 [Lentisphaerae bacterium GWF2_38_69]|nr:MAG: hypothetical protein A2X47_00740 [Lentisphaerae bacterium GWF2_38_69]